jgi:hypothetical protein
MDKHYSLLQKFVNNGHKKFYNIYNFRPWYYLYNYNRAEAASNKSNLLLKILFQNTQTLQLFTFNIKAESY